MMRGTTPVHIFNIPFDTSAIESMRILYAQKEKVILTKVKEDCVLAEKSITVQLSQEDTLLFNSGSLVQIQIRVKTTDGNVSNSDIIEVPVGKCLENEVLL